MFKIFKRKKLDKHPRGTKVPTVYSFYITDNNKYIDSVTLELPEGNYLIEVNGTRLNGVFKSNGTVNVSFLNARRVIELLAYPVNIVKGKGHSSASESVRLGGVTETPKTTLNKNEGSISASITSNGAVKITV